MNYKIINAIADGLIDGGAECTYGFPGFFSQDILKKINPRFGISVNERVAYGQSFGASMAGKRTVVAFKNVGLNIASDAYLHSLISGVNAGIILCITDDIDVWGSQESQDCRHYLSFFGGFLYEPDSLQSAYDFSKNSFELSEKLDIPIIIRITNKSLLLKGVYKRSDKKKNKPISVARNLPDKYVVHPYYFRKQFKTLSRKKVLARQVAEAISSQAPNLDASLGIIKFGSAEISDEYKFSDIFQINTLPIPEKSVRRFIGWHKKIIVSEHGDSIVLSQIKNALKSTNLYTQKPVPDQSKHEFKKWERYENLFKAIRHLKKYSLVVSDISQFTVEKNSVVDIALSMGSAIPIGIGIAENGSRAIVLTGDCSFNHEGIQAIYEAVNRNVNLCIIIINNNVSWCTGAQKNAVPISQLIFPSSIKINSVKYSNKNMKEIKTIIRNSINSIGVNVVRIDVPVGKLER